MSIPVGKPDEPGYIELPQVSKKTRVNPPRSAKEKAIAKTRFMLEEEDKAIRKDRRIEKKHRVKRERPEEGEVVEGEGGRKLRKGQEQKAAAAPARPSGPNPFKILPKDVTRKILRKLYPEELQAARFDSYMNEQVATFVHGQDIPLLQRFTEFLISRLPDLKEAFDIPQETLNALQTRNLDEYTQALYNARSRLIDILETLDRSTLDSLEQEYRKSGYRFPARFEHIFELVRMQGEQEERVLSTLFRLGEVYELVRVTQKQMTEEKRERLSGGVCDRMFNELPRMLSLMDRGTFTLLKQITNSLANGAVKDRNLFILHLYAAMGQIKRGNSDESLAAISKALESIRQLAPLRDNYNHLTLRYSFRRVLNELLPSCTQSNSDAIFIEKMFALFEQAASTYPDDEKQLILEEITARKLVTYFERGFIDQLTTFIHDTVDRLEEIPDARTKCERLNQILSQIYHINNMLLSNNILLSEEAKHGLFRQIGKILSRARDCDAKYALGYALGCEWAVVYDYGFTPRPDVKIRDPEFKSYLEDILDHTKNGF